MSGRTYIIEVKVSGKCMDLAGGATGSGTQVVQETCNTQDPSQWFITASAFPSLFPAKLVVATNPASCVDSEGGFVKLFPGVPGPPEPVAQEWFFTA